MSQKLLHVTISKVDAPVFDGEVISVELPGIDGDMTILADHVPLISPLRPGTVTVTKADAKETFEVTTGVLEMSENHATVLI